MNMSKKINIMEMIDDVKEEDVYDIKIPAYVVKEVENPEGGCVVAWNKEFERLTNFTPMELDDKACNNIFDIYQHKRKDGKPIGYEPVCSPNCDLRCRTPRFTEDEFKNGLNVEKLYEKIKGDYDIELQQPYTIQKLNELLRKPDFYKKWSEKVRTDLKESVDLNYKELISVTNNYCDKNFQELKDNQKENILKLNRLILETTYPDQCPKYLFRVGVRAGVLRECWINSKYTRSSSVVDIKRCVDIYVFPFVSGYNGYALHMLIDRGGVHELNHFKRIANVQLT